MESGWNQERVIQLIDMYRERPVLWDPTNNDFRDRNLKNNAWTEISQGLRMSKIEVKNKMTKVIGQFQRETRKQKSGSGAEAKVKWFAFEHLLFLRDKTASRPTTEANLEMNEREEGEELDMETVNEETETETEITPAPPPRVCADGAMASPSKKRAMTPPQAPNSGKHNKRKTNRIMAEEAYAVLNRLEKKSVVRDHCEVFGENVACQLRQIKDRRLQLVAKHRINQVLFEIGMSDIQPADATSRPGSAQETPSSINSPMSLHDANT